MSVDAWVTSAIVAALFMGLFKDVASSDVMFVGATTLLAALGIISHEEAFAEFSDSGRLKVAVLFIAVAGLRETGMLTQVGHRVIERGCRA